MERLTGSDVIPLRGFYAWLRTPAAQRSHGAIAQWIENEDCARWPEHGRPRIWAALWTYARIGRRPPLDDQELRALASAFRQYQRASGESESDDLEDAATVF